MGRLVCGKLAAARHTVRAFDLPSAPFSELDGVSDVEAARGDLTEPADVATAVDGVDAVVHLAAILPPVADERPELAQRVNVDGTRVLIEEAQRAVPGVRFVFSSSVSVYGKPGDDEVITTNTPLSPDDKYARTKAESEEIVRESGLDWVVLRISGVAIPVFQEPPAEWPFLEAQRIEFVHRDDAVSALVGATTARDAAGTVFNVSGGPTWRMTGGEYVADYFRMLEVDPDEAVYQDSPGHFAWYDSGDGPALLGHQNNPYADYLAQLQVDIDRLMEE